MWTSSLQPIIKLIFLCGFVVRLRFRKKYMFSFLLLWEISWCMQIYGIILGLYQKIKINLDVLLVFDVVMMYIFLNLGYIYQNWNFKCHGILFFLGGAGIRAFIYLYKESGRFNIIFKHRQWIRSRSIIGQFLHQYTFFEYIKPWIFLTLRIVRT